MKDRVPTGGYRIRVTAVRKKPPDLERFVAVLLSMAMKRAQDEQTEHRWIPFPPINLLPREANEGRPIA